MTIAEVSRKYGLSIDTLRYYERVGAIPPVPRNKSGNREYGEEQCRFIELVRCMRAAGIPVETLAEYVALCGQGEATAPKRKQLLLSARIEEMQLTLQRLETEIALYD